MEDVIQAFSQYRLLTLDRDLITRAPTVEVAHEALIREWRTLQGWLNDSREDIRLQRRLSDATAEWLVGRDVSFLATGARLEQFEALSEETHLALTPHERAFIREECRENERQLHAERDRQARELLLAQQREQAQRQSANRLRLLAGVLIIAVIGALFLSGIALNNANIAAQEVNLRATQQHIAEVNFNRAEQQRLYFAAIMHLLMVQAATWGWRWRCEVYSLAIQPPPMPRYSVPARRGGSTSAAKARV